MTTRLRRVFKDLAFKKKLIGICLIVSLIPMGILGIFFYRQMRAMLTERTHTALYETLRQEADHIDGKLESYLAIMDFIAASESVEIALTKDYTRNYDMYLVYRDTVDPLLETMRILYPGLIRITFYSNAQIHPHGTSLRPLTEAFDSPWYEKTLSSAEPQFTFLEDQKTLAITRQVYVSGTKYVNLLAAFVDVQSILGAVHTAFEDDFGFLMLDRQDRPVYQCTHLHGDRQNPALSAEQLLSQNPPKDYVVQTQALRTAGWTAVLYRPVLEIRAATAKLVCTTLLLVLFSSLLVFFFGAKLSALVVLPLTTLAENMRDIENGNYPAPMESDRRDEIGRLICAFDAMARQQNHLVNEVLYAKIAYQKYELRILQSQINPHFLYNSLSLISSRAIRSGQKDIHQVAQLLSTFYRTMLNSGKTTVTISEELDNVKSYISIQQIMHSDSFETVYEVDSTLLECKIPNMLLQPLAENAILHGLDNKETPGIGILTVTCFAQGDDILFKVMDNGSGMTKEQCQNIIRTDSRGYGVKNVHQRVQLYYGKSYGISFHSIPGRGCCALLRIGKTCELC